MLGLTIMSGLKKGSVLLRYEEGHVKTVNEHSLGIDVCVSEKKSNLEDLLASQQ